MYHYQSSREKYTAENPLKKAVKKTIAFLDRTAAEVVIFGAVGLASATTWMYGKEMAKNIPLQFSELSQLEDTAEKEGRELEPLNRFYPSLNDMSMKIFEAWNEGRSRGENELRGFAAELDMSTDPTGSHKIYRRELSDLLKEVPILARTARETLQPFEEASAALGDIDNHFSRAWDESHHNVFHTEQRTRYVTAIDSNGEPYEKEEEYDVEVYDYTIHTYTYHPGEGNAAAKKFIDLLEKIPELAYNENFIVAKKTKPEGEYAIDKSQGGPGTHHNAGEYLEIVNRWFETNMFRQNGPMITTMWKESPSHAKKWKLARQTSESTTYTTQMENDDGPEEFQVAKAAQKHNRRIKSNIDRILTGLTRAETQIPVLEQKIQALINIEMEYQEGPSKRIAAEILSGTTRIYLSNFDAETELQRVRLQYLLLASLFGLGAGAAFGFGLDRAGKKFGLWHTNW